MTTTDTTDEMETDMPTIIEKAAASIPAPHFEGDYIGYYDDLLNGVGVDDADTVRALRCWGIRDDSAFSSGYAMAIRDVVQLLSQRTGGDPAADAHWLTCRCAGIFWHDGHPISSQEAALRMMDGSLNPWNAPTSAAWVATTTTDTTDERTTEMPAITPDAERP